MMENLKQWFGDLQDRERVLVSLGAVVVIVTVLFLATQPLFSATEKARQRVAEKTTDLATLRNASGEVERLGGERITSAGQPLVVIIDRSSSSAQLSSYLKRNQPDGDNAIRVTFEGAPFNGIVDFLGDLQTTHGLALSSATLNKAQAEGTVNASLTLVRAGD